MEAPACRKVRFAAGTSNSHSVHTAQPLRWYYVQVAAPLGVSPVSTEYTQSIEWLLLLLRSAASLYRAHACTSIGSPQVSARAHSHPSFHFAQHLGRGSATFHLTQPFSRNPSTTEGTSPIGAAAGVSPQSKTSQRGICFNPQRHHLTPLFHVEHFRERVHNLLLRRGTTLRCGTSSGSGHRSRDNRASAPHATSR